MLRDAIVVLCAAPREFDAEALAMQLVEGRLAACVQIGGPITSVYRWKAGVERSDERLLLIKTRRDVFPQLQAAIKAAHPYEVPEIVALELTMAHAPYLAWLEESVV